MDSYQYIATCTICETHQELVVLDIDEFPGFCAMCGTELEFDKAEDE